MRQPLPSDVMFRFSSSRDLSRLAILHASGPGYNVEPSVGIGGEGGPIESRLGKRRPMQSLSNGEDPSWMRRKASNTTPIYDHPTKLGTLTMGSVFRSVAHPQRQLWPPRCGGREKLQGVVGQAFEGSIC